MCFLNKNSNSDNTYSLYLRHLTYFFTREKFCVHEQNNFTSLKTTLQFLQVSDHKMKYIMVTLALFILIIGQQHASSVVFPVHLEFTNLIKKREIFIDERIVSMDRLLLQDDEHNVTTDEFITQYPNIVYTALQCTYADVLVELLQKFYVIILHGVKSSKKCLRRNMKQIAIEWLKYAFDRFINIKQYITKIMFTFFSYLDSIAVLRTTEVGLLRSLLATNLFLNYSKTLEPSMVLANETNNENIFDMLEIDKRFKLFNKSVTQIIGLINSFRFKKCVVIDPNEEMLKVEEQLANVSLNQKKWILKTLEPNFLQLKSLNDNVMISYNGFKEYMYDAEYLLFKNCLEYNNNFIGKVNVKLGNNTYFNMQTKYEEVSKTYNIEHTLKFQNILFNLLVDFFLKRIHDSLTRDYSTNKEQKINLLIDFQNLIQITMPKNCLTKECAKIISVRTPLKEAIQNFTEIKLQNLMIVINNITTKNEVKYQIDQQETHLDEHSLHAVVEYIRNNEQYESFSQVMKFQALDLYYRDDDHYIVNECYQWSKKEIKEEIENDFLQMMIDFRYHLFSFREIIFLPDNYDALIASYTSYSLTTLPSTSSSLLGMKPDRYNDLGDLGPIFGQIMTYVAQLYQSKLSTNKAIKDILLPLLIFFRRTDRFSCNFTAVDFPALDHIIIVTITNIENYLLQNYSSPTYNIDIYRKIVIKDDSPLSRKRKKYDDVNEELKFPLKEIDSASHYIDSLYHANMYETFILNSDKHIKMDWDGTPLYAHEVLEYVTRQVMDINVVVNFQWFTMKWFVANILLKIRKTLELTNQQSPNEECSEVNVGGLKNLKNKINNFMTLNYPRSIKVLVNDTVEDIKRITDVNSEVIKINMIDKACKLIDENIRDLNGHLDEFPYSTLDSVLKALQKDIDNFSILLDKLSEKDLYRPYFQLSRWSPISEKIMSFDKDVTPMEID